MAIALGIDGVTVGHWTDLEGATGCTVVLVPEGAVASVDVRGGAPGTRETDLLSPYSAVSEIHGVVLCGASAPGLGAVSGVVTYLEEQGKGYRTPYARIPLIPGAVIYDLGLGSAFARPRAEHGYEAARSASSMVEEGTVGVGTGATVGKLLGETGWMKGGLGVAVLDLPGDVTVAAVSVVNAFGDVLAGDGSVLAGARQGEAFLDSRRHLLTLVGDPRTVRSAEGTNTTLSVVVTDAVLTKTECAIVARMAHDGFARALSPVHTPVDGDTVFVVATGRRDVNIFPLSTAAVEAVTESIRRAVTEARSLAGAPALRDLVWTARANPGDRRE